LFQIVLLLDFVVNVFLFLLLEKKLYTVFMESGYTNFIVSNYEVCLQKELIYIIIL